LAVAKTMIPGRSAAFQDHGRAFFTTAAAVT
jgi:hypothetical protein